MSRNLRFQTIANTWVNRLRFQTLETLRNPDVWAMVDAVAQELVKQKTLDSAGVRALVQKPANQRCGHRVPGRIAAQAAGGS
jgi:hypothetical protein